MNGSHVKPKPARPLILCADDFGQSQAIDDAILALLAQGRLSAVSCMVNGPAWAADAPRLMALPAVQQGQVSVGLHLNLSEGRPLSAALARHWPQCPPLPRLIAQAQLRRLPRAAWQDEPDTQWDCFQQHAGREPQHLDGHQHVHHLPQLRAWVLARQARHPALRVRNTGTPTGPGFALKRALIQGTGGRTLQTALKTRGAAQNSVLLGAYDFQQNDYRACMQAWLQHVPPLGPLPGALLFCHPGNAGAGPDAIAAARLRERDYLAGDAFAQDLRAAGVVLVSGIKPGIKQTTNAD